MSNISRTQLVKSFFFFNDTATTEIYTLSLHDALPIFIREELDRAGAEEILLPMVHPARGSLRDRKSTRLNSSHVRISYAVFCLKKKKGNSDESIAGEVKWPREWQNAECRSSNSAFVIP